MLCDWWVWGKSGRFLDGFYATISEAQFWADIGYSVVSRYDRTIQLAPSGR